MLDTSWIDFNTSDPRKIAGQTRHYVTGLGQELMDKENAEAINQNAQGEQIRGRLNDWITPLAAGQGGYSPEELSRIRMTPQQQADMVKSAGISAGANTAAATGAASRAAAAAGGNPLALAAYRSRAAQQQGSQASDAITKARVAASDSAAQREENIGQTRLGQQQTGLNYYGGLQSQFNQNQQGALGRREQAYGTQTGGTNNAAQLGVSASQTPSTFDKIMGGVAGALPAVASFLEDGDVMPGSGTPAVVGENGPEKVVSTKREYMDTGGFTPTPSLYGFSNRMPSSPAMGPDLGTTTPNADGSMTFIPGADNIPSPAADKPAPGGFKGFLSKMRGAMGGDAQGQQQPGTPGQQTKEWSPVDTYKSIGSAAGSLLALLEDGDVMPEEGNWNMSRLTERAPAEPSYRMSRLTTKAPEEGNWNMSRLTKPAADSEQGAHGIFTQPTRVNLAPGEAVVPLSYRSTAKVRPSKAVLPAAPMTRRPPYGGSSAVSLRP